MRTVLAMMSKIEKNNILVLRSGWPRSKAAKIDYACVCVCVSCLCVYICFVWGYAWECVNVGVCML